MKDFFKFKWLESRPKAMAFSLVLAIIVWAVVVLVGDRTSTRTIDGIPVEIPSAGAAYQALGLDVIDNGQAYTASVTVSGDRAVIGALTAQSLTVTPDFSAVTEAGVYTIRLTAQKNNQLLDYTVKSVDPFSLTFTFGEAESRKFAVEPSVSGMTVADGCVLQTISSSPASVTVTGAIETVDRIARVAAEALLEGEVSSSTTVSAKVVLYDAEGVVIPAESYRIDSEAVELTVPVYREGTLPLTVGFINVPDGFDLSVLKYAISPSEITVASTEANIAALQQKTIGYIDLADFSLGQIYSFDLNLSTGYVNVDNVKTVTVAFDATGLTTRKIAVSDIRVENVPENLHVQIATAAINSVAVVGAADEVEGLLPRSVVAVVNAAELTLEQGSYSVPVSFEIPSSSSVWVAGRHTVVIEVSAAQ